MNRFVEVSASVSLFITVSLLFLHQLKAVTKPQAFAVSLGGQRHRMSLINGPGVWFSGVPRSLFSPARVHLLVEPQQDLCRMDADHERHLAAITERLSRARFRIHYINRDRLINQLPRRRNAYVWLTASARFTVERSSCVPMRRVRADGNT